MKLDELRTVQSKERRKDSLQQLRDSFYEDVAAYIQDLTASRNRRASQVDDPFSDDEVRRLSDELETAEEVAEAIYERRVGKVVKLASFAAADMPVDDEGMTNEERELFEDLVGRISQNKQTVLDVLSGNGESTTPDVTTSESIDSQSTPPVEPVGEAAESASGPAAEPESASEPSAASTGDDSASTDNMLADAMAPDNETAPTAEPDSVTEAEAQAVAGPPDSSDTDPEVTDAQSASEIPPDQPQRERDTETVSETTTDGGTATTNTASTDNLSTTDSSKNDSSPHATAETTDTTETAETASKDDGEDRTTLRITKNVGDIFGVDGREYTLRSEDVVTLPTTNAEPLVERDAALRLE